MYPFYLATTHATKSFLQYLQSATDLEFGNSSNITCRTQVCRQGWSARFALIQIGLKGPHFDITPLKTAVRECRATSFGSFSTG